MNYKIINLSWYKRRIPLNEIKNEIINIELEGFEFKKYSLCTMNVFYKNEKKKLSGQVIHNEIKDKWMVNGIDASGNQVAIEIMRGN